MKKPTNSLLLFALIGMLWLGHVAFAQQYPPNIPVSQRTHSESETAIAVSPLNADYILAGWNAKLPNPTRDRSGYAFSYDGGQTWEDSLIEHEDNANPVGIDPSVAFDRHGNAFFCQMGGNGQQSEHRQWIRVWRRAIPNGTWEQNQVSIRLPALPVHNDKPYMAIDNSGFSSPGNVYVAWTEYFQGQQGSRIKFNRSTDGGQTFDTLNAITLHEGVNTVQITDPLYVFMIGALPVVGPSGELYVFWARGASGQNDGTIYFRKSTDGGATWSPPLGSDPASTVQMKPVFGSVNYGELQIYTLPCSVIDTNGVVHLAFSAMRPNSEDITVYLTKSTDGGTTWRWGNSDTIRTNQSSTGLRFMPWLAVDKWNALHMVYYHGPGQNLTNVYVASLLDGESDFDFPDVRINEVTFNASSPFIGRQTHYIGIASSTSGDVLPCWTDAREAGTKKGDSYAAQLNLSSPQPPALVYPPDPTLPRDNLVFSWNPAFGARLYRIEIDDDPSFGSPFIDSTLSTTYQYAGSTLTKDTPYYWRVRSENPIGVGEYSDQRTFIAKDPLEIQTTYPVNWNLASVPLYVAYFHRDSVWGNRIGQPFKYDNGYVEVAMLENGPGYWVKFPSTETTVDYVGGWWDTLNVSVGTNWNIIGSTHATVDTEDIQYVGTSRGSNYFKYDNGYQIATTIEPGFGYWVKFNSAGTIRLIASVAMSPSGGGEDELATYDKFTIMDAEGKQQDLYVRNGTLPSSFEDEYWEMPPAPPEEAFDVRLETDMFVKTVDPSPDPVDLTFLMTGVEFPATLSWQINPENGITYTLPDSGNGLGKTTAISNVGGLTLMNRSNRLQLRAWIPVSSESATVPKDFSLRQNFPNPFNPMTTIKYDLPFDTKVTLMVYDVLGREVRTLINKEMPAGFHQVTVDGSSLASGVYLYRIDAGTFTQVRKLVLLK